MSLPLLRKEAREHGVVLGATAALGAVAARAAIRPRALAVG
jgi:hypothetical protein